MTDHYSTLGVQRGASAEDIKKAYRKMASQHHPDKGGDTQKFQQIEEAYRTLSDDNARAQYDNPQTQYRFHPGSGSNPFEDLFRHMGGSPWGDIFGQHRHQQARNRTINAQTTITLYEALHGKELLANIAFPGNSDNVMSVKIPAGVHDGTVLRLSGMGEDLVPGAPRGDIHLTINIQPHPEFQRQGDDLVKELSIPVWSAILGDKIDIKTLDGKELEMILPAGTQHDQVLSIQGAGMPNMNDNRFRGRLLLKVKLVIPDNLTDQQKQRIRQAIA